jgi:hypothetical protein
MSFDFAEASQALPTKHCNKCDEDYPTTDEHFFRNGKAGWYSVCKLCRHDQNVAKAEVKRANRPPKEPKQRQPGMCKQCHIRPVEPGHTCDVCRIRAKQARDKIRQEVITAYGEKCACCGENHPEFLAIDHIDGGGRVHSKEVGAGFHMCYWLRNHGFPDGFQVLCHNCNQAKYTYGICPHQSDKNEVLSHGRIDKHEYLKHWRHDLREQVIASYGGKCICCGCDRNEFLVIDHINGGGVQHRLHIGGGAFYSLLRRHGFPQDEYQLLCHNCNWAKFAHKTCPHQR